MNGDLLDLVLIALMVAFAVSGYRQGFIIGAMSFVGFVGGLLLGVFIAPPIAGAVVDGDTEQALLAIVIVFLTAIIGQFASSTIGAVIRSHVTWEPAKVVDAVGGTFASALAVLIGTWFIGSLVASSQFTMISEQVHKSLLLGTVDDAMPQAAKDIQDPIKDFIDKSGFPKVFDGIGGGRLVEVAPPDQGVLKGNPRLERARRSIVKVQGVASSCRKHIEGTGFVYAQNKIMTNAHVVAGVDQDLQIIDHRGDSRPARVVLYNPDRDIAVLHVPGLDLPILRFYAGEVETGDDAIIAGFPHGQGFTPNEARIRVRHKAKGTDIYERNSVVRDVYAIRGLVRQGNSGGPLLTPDGRVYGVVFAAALDQQETGYVLTAGEVAPDAEDGSRLLNRVDTQECDH
ncbi:MarP family serine protease [Planomonospora sp. ID91781]|nr:MULTISPECIES: MarP family serine protease [Planomonospora]MBG0820246.1 MarP family serine protease [Planomonospora sp. ID91781]GGK80359.1 acid resistance periplasmic serine protease MarP [Planomonospora parontospora]GII11326.1 acid resistance periplasmic serine protease MarP [Planomonospora parontospora subsp. parontospora]